MYRDYIKQFGHIKSSGEKRQKKGKLKLRNGMNHVLDEDYSVMNGDLDPEESEKHDIICKEIKLLIEPKKQRKLVLHFDIRNTVLVADSVTNVSVEQALNSFLTGVTWGKEDEHGMWQWHSDKLSLTPPRDDLTTYYKYLERQFVQTTTDRTRLRLATGDFTQSEIGKIFYHHFQNHLEVLRWRHEYIDDDHNCFTMKGKDGQPYNYIVPAVYKCIHYLVETKRDFAIVFRTYGLDAPNVIKSLSYGLKGNHPGYTKPLDLKINENIGKVKRSETEPIVFEEHDNPDIPEATARYQGDRDIYNMLCQRTGISGFRDDINFWLDNSYHHSTAKPHIIDPFDNDVHHIFFDDNIRTFEEDSIVDVRLFESQGAEEARSLSSRESALFDNVCMIQADLIRCIEDDNYYLDRVKDCEVNYTNFLRRWQRLPRSVSVQVML